MNYVNYSFDLISILDRIVLLIRTLTTSKPYNVARVSVSR